MRYEISEPSPQREDDVIIYVDVLNARHLAKKDPFGLSDPYVQVSLYINNRLVSYVRTATIKKTLCPVWNTTVQVRLRKASLNRSMISFEVFDANRITRDDFLGKVEVEVKMIRCQSYDSVQEQICPLQQRSSRSRVTGDLIVKLCRVDREPEHVPTVRDQSSSDEALADWELVREPSTSTAQPLPPGWEERVDANGRTFYVDHTSRRTQWDRPQISDEPSDQTSRARADFQSRRLISREDTQPRLRRATVASSSSSDSNIAAAVNQTADEPLPPGWTLGYTDAGKVFFIDHNTQKTTWDDPRLSARQNDLKPRSSENSLPSMVIQSDDTLGPLPDGWEMRKHSDGRSFFIDHVHKKTQWEDPRLAVRGGPAVKYNRNYQEKYNYFRSTLRKPANLPSQVQLDVKRKDLLETSFNAVMGVSNTDHLKARLWVVFDGEKGLDYGGVSREWFYLLSKEMFNPYYGLFENSAVDNYTLQINHMSGTLQERHLDYFRFIGRVAGMAIYHGKLLDGFFIRPFYKMMLDKEITLHDMESVDIEYFNSLNWVYENDPEDLELTFSVDEEVLGVVREIELVPGGSNRKVTNANKHDYVRLAVQRRFCGRIKEQMSAFNKGFDEIISRHCLKVFDENELEMVMCGIQDINVNDWKENTNYKGNYGPNHPTIVNFWKAIYLMSNESRARLLQFVTGTSRVPSNGFKELYGSNGPQKFTIENWGTVDKYPRAHTCFNRLDLPPYSSYETLITRLTSAIENCEGFEGVD